MNLLARFVLVAAMVGFAGCATGPTVTADYDRSANFASYRSFGFYSPLGTDKAGYQSLITQTIKSAVTAELEARGYTYTETAPDLLVNFNAKLARQTQVSQTPSMYYGYRRGFYGGWGGYGYDTHVYQYTEGTLNVDIVDAKRQQLVWEGVAVGRVTKKDQAERQAAIRAAVAEVFAKYPFRAGQ
jgi:hypothetical protein